MRRPSSGTNPHVKSQGGTQEWYVPAGRRFSDLSRRKGRGAGLHGKYVCTDPPHRDEEPPIKDEKGENESRKEKHVKRGHVVVRGSS